MYTELRWLAVGLLMLGLLVFAGLTVRLIRRARQGGAGFRVRRESRRCRLGLDHEQS